MEKTTAIEAVPHLLFDELPSVLQHEAAGTGRTVVLAEEKDLALSHVPPVSVRTASHIVIQCHTIDVLAQHLPAEVQDGSGGERVGQDGCAQEWLPAPPAQVSAEIHPQLVGDKAVRTDQRFQLLHFPFHQEPGAGALSSLPNVESSPPTVATHGEGARTHMPG